MQHSTNISLDIIKQKQKKLCKERRDARSKKNSDNIHGRNARKNGKNSKEFRTNIERLHKIHSNRGHRQKESINNTLRIYLDSICNNSTIKQKKGRIMTTHTITSDTIFEAQDMLLDLTCQVQAVQFVANSMIENQENCGSIAILINSIEKINIQIDNLENTFKNTRDK